MVSPRNLGYALSFGRCGSGCQSPHETSLGTGQNELRRNVNVPLRSRAESVKKKEARRGFIKDVLAKPMIMLVGREGDLQNPGRQDFEQ